MKIRIDLKDPDGVWESLKSEGLDPNELPDDVEQVVEKFFMYSEYVSVELDTETSDARVLSR